MAEDRPVTPEKQLLKLIEEPSGSGANPHGSRQAFSRPSASRAVAASPLSFSALRGILVGRFSFWRRTTRKQLSWSKMMMDLSWANRLLWVALIGLTAYMALDMFGSMMALKESPNFAFQKEKKAPSTLAASSIVSPLKEAAYYVEKVNARDIFHEGSKRSIERNPVREKPEPLPADNAAFKDLSLVGISWSANPDVIIEDKARQKTHFVKRGQVIGDGVKIEAVFKDHVVLSYEGQEFELR